MLSTANILPLVVCAALAFVALVVLIALSACRMSGLVEADRDE